MDLPPSTADVKPEVKKEEEEEQKPSITEDLGDAVAAYYAEMAREEEREAKEEASSEEEEEEDEDEFEDVGVTTNGSATPQVDSTPVTAPLTNGSLKRELEPDSGSSGTNTNAATPLTPADEGPASKKVKFDDDVKKKPISDEEDEEFEDV